MAFVLQGACLALARERARATQRTSTKSSCSAAARRAKCKRSPRNKSSSCRPARARSKPSRTCPGVNFQSADPYGSYEWSTRITVRGFNQNRMGFTLDGVPLGDMTYGNHNGLHISRAIPTELVDRVVLSQGTGTLATASASNLGGAIEFFSAARARSSTSTPPDFGSDSARRTFVRVDTGELGRRYAPVVRRRTTRRRSGKAPATKTCASTTSSSRSPSATASSRSSTTIPTASRSTTKISRKTSSRAAATTGTTGTRAGSLPSPPRDACNASGQNDAIACDDAYWNASGLRQDDLGYVALDLPFGDSLVWTANVYAHRNEGQGLWGTPYTVTPGGAPLSIRTTEYDLARDGLVTALTWTGGNHEIKGGLWYETNDFTQARRFYGEPSRIGPTRSFEDFQTNPLLTQWEYDFDTESVVLHLQDTGRSAMPCASTSASASVNVENTAATVVGDVKTGTIEADEPFLPQIGVNWAISDELELFTSVAKNVRAFASSGTSGPFSTTAAGFAAIRDVVEPETATNFEAGLRFRAGD